MMRRDAEKRPVSDGVYRVLFLTPVLLVVTLFVLVPVLGAFRTSLYRDVSFLPETFVGAGNFRALFSDPDLGRSLRFTLLFVLVSVPLEVILGLGVALAMNESFPGRGLLRSAVLIPWAVPAAVSGRTFQLVYDYSYGAANSLLSLVNVSPVNWRGTEGGAFFALLVADVWKSVPFVAIILLAGLAAVPDQLYQQAKIDRAGVRRRFVSITLPLLRPVLVVTLLFRSLEALRIFDLVFVLTGGGPGGSTTSLSLLAYESYSGGDFGYGSAVSVVLFLIALVISLLYVRMADYGGEL